ncbi:hypothetical protein [Paraburkholderia sp. SIMBA_054]|uniref:hypothetical protein n=1 Tax=Paraburkholderia sp. SIMBA_054 TaxID=3085795 RepID=UPI00397895B5
MNTIFRSFFYAFGAIMIWALYSMDPNTATFKDVLQILHLKQFWGLVELLALCLFAVQFMFSGNLDPAFEDLFDRLFRVGGQVARTGRRR